MRLGQAYSDVRGSSAVEFALTAPVFLMMVFGIIECGLLLWTQLGLQHGVEMAARCASIDAKTCGSTSDIQKYAAQKAYGLKPPSSIFTVSTPACGSEVGASYPVRFVVSYFGAPSLTLKARSCFPK
jgi:Flp pilus assembly protein TadG